MLTENEIRSVCLSVRHDFGLMTEGQQQAMIATAREWERAFEKEKELILERERIAELEQRPLCSTSDLYNRTEGCDGRVVSNWPRGGVKCSKCSGWFCY